jgi:hypothetical protein
VRARIRIRAMLASDRRPPGSASAAEEFGREQGAAFVEVTAGRHRPDARHLYEALGYDATVTAYLRKRL